MVDEEEWAENETIFIGEKFCTLKAAENSALLKVFSYIELRYNIEVRDVSFGKILVLNGICRDLFNSINVLVGKLTVVLYGLEDALRILGKLHDSYARDSNRYLVQFTECVEELKDESIKEYKTICGKFTLLKDEAQCLYKSTCCKEEVSFSCKIDSSTVPMQNE
uniref:Uncharacterized protein n=1 Tax=Arundo donax TaxID=35708 RepID=A0A0A9GWD7_ARUDO